MCRLTQAGRLGTDMDEKMGRGREGDTCKNVRTRSADQQGEMQDTCSMRGAGEKSHHALRLLVTAAVYY